MYTWPERLGYMFGQSVFNTLQTTIVVPSEERGHVVQVEGLMFAGMLEAPMQIGVTYREAF